LFLSYIGTKSGDYHDEKNWENFQTWLKSQSIPNLPSNSVLVVDNDSYHNIREMKEPTSTTRKADMLLWLEEKQLPTDPKLTKPELYSIIKDHKSQHRTYKLDLLMASYGHKVLRLPSYHPELNPIEKIWASVKNWVAVHNTTFKLKDVEQLA
jgi:transposase